MDVERYLKGGNRKRPDRSEPRPEILSRSGDSILSSVSESHRSTKISPAELALKRALDVAGSAIGLLLLSPVFFLIALAIKADSPGPVFFRQTRVGRGGEPFQIFKFRSMTVAAPKLGPAITTRDDNRVTRVGAFIRRWKLDELPQLLNVLAGDMSLVGPRPEVPEFMSSYTPEQREVILSMRPGMTDYAAIIFRDESALLSSRENPAETYRREIMPIKFGHYERYARDMSLATDVKIILATVSIIAFGRIPAILGIEPAGTSADAA